MRQSARTVLSSLLLLSTIAPVAIHATATTAPVAIHATATTAPVVTRPLATPPRLPHVNSPTPAQRARLLARYAHLPLSFEPNRGQAPRQVRFLARGAGYTLSLTAHGATLTLAAPLPVSRDFPPSSSHRLHASLRPHLMTHMANTKMRAVGSRVMPTGTVGVGSQSTATPIPSSSGATGESSMVTPFAPASPTTTTPLETATVSPTAAPSIPTSPITATAPPRGRRWHNRWIPWGLKVR